MSFILRRFVFYLVAILIAISFNFLIPRLMPGDPVDALFASAQGRMPLETLQAYKEMLGFVEGPLWLQYLQYMKSIFTWDLGPTIMLFPLPVTELLAIKLPWTLGLAGMSTIICVMIGLIIGTFAAYNRGSFTDRFMPAFAAFMGAMPQPVTALFLVFRFGIKLEVVPTVVWRQSRSEPWLDPRVCLQRVTSRCVADPLHDCWWYRSVDL